MSRPRQPIPPYLYHRPSEQARIRIGRRDYYLGGYGTRESVRKYLAMLQRYLAGRFGHVDDAEN